MRKLSTFAFLLIFLISCSKQDGDFSDPVKFDLHGVKSHFNKENQCIEATIPAEGAQFTYVQKSGMFGFITGIKINGTPTEPVGWDNDNYGFIHTDGRPLPWSFKGEWGEFEYLTNTSPYVIFFNISPNTGTDTRRIEVVLGMPPGGGKFILIQSAPDSD